jgi:hypothetical protein
MLALLSLQIFVNGDCVFAGKTAYAQVQFGVWGEIVKLLFRQKAQRIRADFLPQDFHRVLLCFVISQFLGIGNIGAEVARVRKGRTAYTHVDFLCARVP